MFSPTEGGGSIRFSIDRFVLWRLLLSIYVLAYETQMMFSSLEFPNFQTSNSKLDPLRHNLRYLLKISRRHEGGRCGCHVDAEGSTMPQQRAVESRAVGTMVASPAVAATIQAGAILTGGSASVLTSEANM